MKRVDMVAVRLELKKAIEKYHGKFCVDTVIPKEKEVWHFVVEELEDYLETVTGESIHFRESDDTFMKINNYIEGYFKPLREFTFTPNQEEAWLENTQTIRWKMFNELVDLAENSEDDFYGEQYCTEPLKEILSKYCDSWK